MPVTQKAEEWKIPRRCSRFNQLFRFQLMLQSFVCSRIASAVARCIWRVSCLIITQLLSVQLNITEHYRQFDKLSVT